MYHVEYTPTAKRNLKQLKKRNREMLKRIDEIILSLEDNPRPHGAEKLSGDTKLRIRERDYRILYTVDDGAQRVLIDAVRDRKEVYKKP